MAKEKLYWPPAVTVDVVIFTIEEGELKVLLIKRENTPFKGVLALPGGFLLKNEPPQKAADRILKEKAGVKDVYTEQLYTFDDPGRDPRGHIISITYFALIRTEDIVIKKGKETQAPAFYPVKKLPRLAFDHDKIINYAVKRLRAKLEYTNVVFSLLPGYFTLYQLQKTYEAILGRKLDKRNFQKKFLSLGLIALTGKISRQGSQRPARLYRFISHRPAELKKFF
jgi:8-oxo-dGTP diphosphatase